jgi:DNA replication protein DnaC
MPNRKKSKGQNDDSAKKTSTLPSASTSGVEGPTCKVCRGHGHLRRDLPIDDPEFGKYVPCWNCRPASKNEIFTRSSGLDAENAPLLDEIDTQGRRGTAAMVRSARKFVGRPAGIRTFWGGCGNGKTMTLQACVNELVRGGTEAVYINGHDLLEHIREAFGSRNGSKGESPQKRFERYCTVPVLAIDEFDKVNSTGWAEEKLMALIDRRYVLGNESRAGTLIAMNTDPRELRPWIASRLLDGKNQVVHNADADIRPALR